MSKELKPESYKAGITCLTLMLAVYMFMSKPNYSIWWILLAFVAILILNLIWVWKIENRVFFPAISWWMVTFIVVCCFIVYYFVFGPGSPHI